MKHVYIWNLLGRVEATSQGPVKSIFISVGTLRHLEKRLRYLAFMYVGLRSYMHLMPLARCYTAYVSVNVSAPCQCSRPLPTYLIGMVHVH